MIFAEKLSFLIKLTGVSNKQLADALSVDPSLISRLRNSRRETPKNRAYLDRMAEFFAKRCVGNYQRLALSEALGRKYLQIQMETGQLAAVLFDWLTDSRDQAGKLLSAFDGFSITEGEPTDGQEELPALPKTGANNFAYYGNDGKRSAVSVFFSHLLTLEEPGTVLLTDDENSEWMLENPAYLAYLEEQLRLLMQRGFRICRIAPPLLSADQAFDSLSRWLPLYMTGQVEAWYYPRLRDELYRRMLIALPGEAAVVSTSTAGQAAAGATILTQDARLADAFAAEFQNTLLKCRPMMMTYSSDVNMDALLRCIIQFDDDAGNRIQQSSTLSALTVPAEVVQGLVRGLPDAGASPIIPALAKSR